MSEERSRILDMLASGKINAEEAARLLDAIERPAAEPTADTEPTGCCKPKYLRVVVEPKVAGKETVNIRIPLQLIRMGAKLSGLMPEKTRGKIDQKLTDHGIGLDFDKLDADGVEALIVALTESSIDVDDEKEKVRICCE